VPFSTSPSPGRTSPMQFSRSVFTCMIPGSPTSRLSSASSATSGARSTTASYFIGPPPPTLSSTLTLTGGVPRHSALHLRLRCLLGRKPGVLVV
jgi:hypothetical protein